MTLKNYSRLAAFLLIVLNCQASFAGTVPASSPVSTQSLSTIVIGKKSAVVKNEPPVFSMPDVTLGYRIASDFAQPARQREFSHEFELDIESQVNGLFTLGLSLGYEYLSLENEIYKSEQTSSLTDLTIYAAKRFVLDRRNSITTSLTETLPTSESSQFEGVKSIVGMKNTLSTGIYKRTLSWITSLQGNYIFNTYDKNAVNLGANPKSSVGLSLGPALSLTKAWRASFLMSARSTQFIDADSTMRYMNVTTTSYSIQSWKFSLSYLNGSYSDQNGSSNWWVDQYRQQLSTEVTYEF